MNRTLFTLLGVAGIAAVGAVLGRSGGHTRRGYDETDDMELAHRDTLAALIDKYARALPDDEAETLLRRNRARLREWK